MDNFDKKISKMAKNETWEVPQYIDDKIDNILNNLDKPKVKKARPMKVAVILAAIITFTFTTAFAIENIVRYFNYNKDSAYISSKDDMERIGKQVNLSVKDKGIEFTVDSISVDDNYINVFYTIKSDNNIKTVNKEYENPWFARPFISIKVDGREIYETSMIEGEAIYTSDTELKGLRRMNITHENIKDKFDMEIYTDEIFMRKGNWIISTKVDKSKVAEETLKYNINKDVVIRKNYTNPNRNIDIDHKVNIDKVYISPLASQIVLKEKVEITGDFEPMIGNEFALFDENGKSLDVIDKGMKGPINKIATNSFEFIKANKNTKSLTLIPIELNFYARNYTLKSQSIDKLPIEFNTSEYGKVIIEDIKITDKEIKYIYYKEGVHPYSLYLTFFNKDGKEIKIGAALQSESVNRHTGRYTVTLKLEKESKKNINIKKVATYSKSDIKLLYDQKVNIDLKN